MAVRRKAQFLFFILALLIDGSSVLLAFALAFWLRFYSGLIPVRYGIPPFLTYFYGSLFVVAIWMFVFYMHKLYDSESGYSFVDEVWEIFKSSFVGSFVVLAPTFFLVDFEYSRLTFIMACPLSFGCIIIGRTLLRVLTRRAKARGFGVKRVAIVGGGEMGKSIRERIEKHPTIGYRLVGQIIEENERIEGVELLGTIDNIRQVVEEFQLDTLIMTFPLRRHHRVLKVLEGTEDLKVEFRFVPDIYELMTSAISHYELDGIPLIGLKEFPLEGWNRVIKRLEDIVGSLVLLAIFSPVMIISTIVIKLTSRGPVFFRQERIGEDGRAFNIMKFRSMRINAEQETGPVFARENDTRRTRIGRILRKLSLDEIPQLFNVLKGEMSLVGPRPERPHFVDQFKREIPRYLERHKVKSGITGWAQVNGLRGNTSIPDRIKHDLYYIENWSLGFDLKIMMRTVIEVVKSKVAY